LIRTFFGTVVGRWLPNVLNLAALDDFWSSVGTYSPHDYLAAVLPLAPRILLEDGLAGKVLERMEIMGELVAIG
jgi:hypothetical protein